MGLSERPSALGLKELKPIYYSVPFNSSMMLFIKMRMPWSPL